MLSNCARAQPRQLASTRRMGPTRNACPEVANKPQRPTQWHDVGACLAEAWSVEAWSGQHVSPCAWASCAVACIPGFVGTSLCIIVGDANPRIATTMHRRSNNQRLGRCIHAFYASAVTQGSPGQHQAGQRRLLLGVSNRPLAVRVAVRVLGQHKRQHLCRLGCTRFRGRVVLRERNRCLPQRPGADSKVQATTRSHAGSPTAEQPKSITAASAPSTVSRLPAATSPCSHTGAACQRDCRAASSTASDAIASTRSASRAIAARASAA